MGEEKKEEGLEERRKRMDEKREGRGYDRRISITALS